ncbi:MAG: hypothetical protein JW833_07325, partial [Prolixibacteraceae bacterium]|nr:hypothetical protein [Prolixibacteraceae bacterium]
GKNFRYIFDNEGNYYKLDAGKLPVGNYSYSAEVTIGEEEFTESGEFSVVPLQIENTKTRANFNVLYQMANLTGGELFYSDEAEKLVEKIRNNNNIKPTHYFQASITELLNLKWLFFVILIVLGVEWFLRKYWGIY